MNKPLLYFSYSIIVLNALFFLIGFMNNIGAVGAIAGGLMAIGSDTIIIFMAIIIGTGLVVYQSRFSILYFMLAAVVGAAAVHYFLGTTKLIVDIIRVDVLLIIPALIVIITSFFTPKSKAIKTELIKVEPSILKMMRILILIFGAAISGFILFADTDRGSHDIDDTLFGKYITYSIVKPFHMERTLNRCKVKDLKSSCYNYGESRVMRDLTVAEINKEIKTGQITVLKEKRLKKTYEISMWVVHIVLFIISMVAIFKLRFCIVHVLLTRTRYPEKKGKSNIIESINKFFKSI
tara:strand:+ start:1400 stop:2278 length:879 start_codon:yes stop_codon:yes gene_type:complete